MGILIEVLLALSINFLIFVLTLWFCLLGVVIVPVALFLVNDSHKNLTYRSEGTNEWWYRTLPKWAKMWDNKVDGALGDPDFRWASRDIPFGWKNTSYLGQFWWMAIRNPANYLKRFVLSCDVRKNRVEKIAGQDYVRDDLDSTGWQFLKCGKFYTFYGVWKWPKTERAVVVQLGNKFDLEDNYKTYLKDQDYKYYKGFTFEINPFKFIGEK